MTTTTATPSPAQDVVFYVLSSSDDQNRDQFVGKLVNKIHSEKRQCDIRLASDSDCQRLDNAIWEFKPHAFIPHAVALQVTAPIQLWNQQIGEPCEDVLLNLHPEFLPTFTQYQRTIEVLDQSDALLQRGRERWKQYRNQGFEPVVHKIQM